MKGCAGPCVYSLIIADLPLGLKWGVTRWSQ